MSAAPWCEGMPLRCQEAQGAFASAAEENRKPKGLFRTIPFLPSHSSQISSMMRRNFFSFSWPKMTPWSLDLPPLAFFPLSVLTCIIFVNLLSSRSVLCLWRSLLCSSWSLLSSSPCPLFWGRLKILGLTSKKDPTKRNLLMFETFGKGASKCSKYESFWTYQQIHSLKLTAKATEKWWKGKDPASLRGKRPIFQSGWCSTLSCSRPIFYPFFPCCPFPRHLVGKMIIHFSFRHH